MQIRTLVLALAGILACGAQPQFPDTPAGHQFSAWLEAFNNADPKVFHQFLAKNYPSDPGNIDQDARFREQTGGFEFKKAEESTATKFTGLVKERSSDQVARFVIEVASTEPHLITKLDLRAIPSPPELGVSRMSESDLLAALRVKLDQDSATDK